MSPKKKSKKKGDILARMSVEQRRQYLERKAAQEQEKTRRREELLAGFLKLKLEDEQKKATTNESKLNVKWRSILRQITSDSLTSQLQNLKLWTDETLESQDNLIDMLNDALQDARDQRAMASEKHLKVIRTLADLHEEHISLLSKNFCDQEMRLINETNTEMESVTDETNKLIQKLKVVKVMAIRKTQDQETREMDIYENAFARIKTKLEEEAELALEEEEERLQKAWLQLAHSMKEHDDETSELRNECNTLQQKVTSNLATKHKLDQEIREMKNEITFWRERMKEEKDGVLKEEENNADMTLQTLRTSIDNQKSYLRESVKNYNRITGKAFERLEETVNLGEEILHLANLCHRLETAEDKNIPYLPVVSISADSILGNQVDDTGKSSVFQEEYKLITESFHRVKAKPQLQTIPESESGIGSSITASSLLNTGEKDGYASQSDTSQSTDYSQKKKSTSYSIPENSVTVEPLPKVTLERIHSMLKDEALLKEASESSSTNDSTQPPSEYVLKETELLLRTHESLSPFWNKLNNVQVQRLSLKKEAEDLMIENKQLKETLKNYFLNKGLNNECLSTTQTPLSITGIPVDHTPLKSKGKKNSKDRKSKKKYGKSI